MIRPDNRFRENPDRAVYVLGEIHAELFRNLNERINRLRVESSRPITVYIDSPGGSVDITEKLRGLLSSPNIDGAKCELLTIVTGVAASAAADLLSLGDYAIALPHSEVVYHGTREEFRSPVTYELATNLATTLKEENEFFALRLARTSFPRFVFRASQFDEWLREYQEHGSPKLVGLVAELRGRLSPRIFRLLQQALTRQNAMWRLSVSVGKHIGKFKKQLSPAQIEAEMLKCIITYHAKVHADQNWLISTTGLQDVIADFSLLHDYYFGDHRSNMAWIVENYGQLFITRLEQEEFLKLQGTDEEKKLWLHEKAERKLEDLWYFMVSICRVLQSADFRFTAEEAYWLGLVDEVQGSGLPNLRELIEQVPDQPALDSPH